MFQANAFMSHLMSQPSGRYVRYILTEHQYNPAKFVSNICRDVLDVLPALSHGKTYKAEDLIDPCLWSSYTPGLRRVAGTCLAHLVERGELSLAFAKGRTDYPLLYCLPKCADEVGSTHAHRPLIRRVRQAVPAKHQSGEGHLHNSGRKP
jgi:hypothetical protein